MAKSQDAKKNVKKEPQKTAKERKALLGNLNMDIGAIVGQAVQDIIVHKLTLEEVMKGKK